MDIVAKLKELGKLEKERYAIKNEILKEGIRVCGVADLPAIHLYNGIEEIAKMIGTELTETKFADFNQKSFVLDDVTYFQITSSLDGSYLKMEEKEDENN